MADQVEPDNDTVTLDGPLFGVPLPSIDATTLDAHVMAIGPHASSSQKPSSDSTLLAARALWNARLPVHRLPTELLVDLLMRLPSYAYVARTSVSNSALWFMLMLVCRRWRAVVKANPCFWRSINVGKNTRWLNIALARSGDSNLSLDFSISGAFLSSLPRLVDMRNRIELLRFNCYGAPSLKSLEPLLCMPLPSLTEFSAAIDTLGNVFNIEYPGHDTPGHREVLQYDPDHFSAVVNLSLEGAQISIPWATSFISNLRVLHVRGCMVYSTAMSVSSFLEVLRAGQRLEELTLQDLLPWTCTGPPESSERLGTVALPHLRKAIFIDRVAWISLYLSYIEFPRQGDVTFTGLIDGPALEENPALHYTSMLPPDIRTFSFLSSTTSATMSMNGSSYSIACKGPGPTVTLHLTVRSIQLWWQQTAGAAVAHFADILRDAPLTDLEFFFELDFEQDIIDLDVFDVALAAFPQVQELRLRSRAVGGADDIPFSLCHSLGHRNLNPIPGEVDVLLPDLRILRVQQEHETDSYFLPELLECLSNRMDGGAPKLELVAITMRRTGTHNWRAFDAHYGGVFMPLVENYEFVDEGWGA